MKDISLSYKQVKLHTPNIYIRYTPIIFNVLCFNKYLNNMHLCECIYTYINIKIHTDKLILLHTL